MDVIDPAPDSVFPKNAIYHRLNGTQDVEMELTQRPPVFSSKICLTTV